MLHKLPQGKPHHVVRSSPIQLITLGIAVAIGYWLAARLSLLFLTPADGVAVFWPAAGIASGILIALGSKARLPIAAGVMAATVAANLEGDRNLASAIVFAFANAGEALFAAWLINRHSRRGFSLDSVHSVLNLTAAIGVAAAVSGVVATLGFILLHNLGASAPSIWLNWSAADVLGAITVAPVTIGLARLFDDVPGKRESLEGIAVLVVLTVVSVITLAASSNHWFTIAPLGFILPLLLWLAVRCRPLFTAAGVFTIALSIVATARFGLGRLGDPSIPLLDRVHVARTALLVVSLCGLLLAALFAERRRSEAALRESDERLRLALEGAELGIWCIDLISGRFENNTRDRQIHGHDMQRPPQTLAQARSFIHHDDLAIIDQGLRAAGRARTNYKVEYRSVPTTTSTPAHPERWVALDATVLRDGHGRPVQILGVTRDITERTQLAGALQENERKLRGLLEALPAAIYVTDAAGYVTYCNQTAVELWGIRPKVGEDKWCDLARFYSRDGAPMPIEDCPTEIALKQGRIVRSAEAIMERQDGTRIPIMPSPSPLYNQTGTVVGVINMTLDITERKKAEFTLAERTMQLDLAGKIALVGTFTFDVATGRMQVSAGYAAIHGLPEGTVESSRAAWRDRVHSEDLARLETHFERTIAVRKHEHYCDYRIVWPDGEVRWIESRSFISYDEDGPRLVGANIDVTDRKKAELALAERNVQLALAGEAAGAGTYVYDIETDLMQVTQGYAALHGLPDGTTETRRSQWRARVHPEDLAQVEAARRHAFRERQAEHGFEYRIIRAGGEVRWIESRSFISYTNDHQPQRIIGLNIDVTERRRAEDHQRVLLAELDHRVKNVLATVAAVAASTLETSSSMQQFVAALDARIRALASTHELLSASRWQGLSLNELLKLQLAPYATTRNMHIVGPNVQLVAEAGQAIGMVLHELATNAAKYGALSVHTGQVSVQWHLSQDQAARDGVVIEWRESGGPPVQPPDKFGYGTNVVTDLIPYELGGKTECQFLKTGVQCRLEVPSKWTIVAPQPNPNLSAVVTAPTGVHETV